VKQSPHTCPLVPLLLLLLLLPFSALADDDDEDGEDDDDEEEILPFDQGCVNLGLGLGGGSVGGKAAFNVGVKFGYFVLPGLEPGVETSVTFGSDQPTVISLLPYLRWIIYRALPVSPYLMAQAGRLFVITNDPLYSDEDFTAVGGGGGVIVFLHRSIGLQLGGKVLALPGGETCDPCVIYGIDLSLGFIFGGGY
jgi:hypothetical protein